MPDGRQMPDEPPPLLGSWPRVYILVLAYLALLILLFYAFTLHFS
ncbi:MAG TPA: hypothetical protein VJN43_03360 [Bryobacteraceae bacterium]|nr:hypothetical protein [Bryobacteraceae bacterium]